MDPLAIMENYIEYVRKKVRGSRLRNLLRNEKNEEIITVTLRLLAIPIVFTALLGFIVGFANLFTLFGISVAAMVNLMYEGWNPLIAVAFVVMFNTVTVTFLIVCMEVQDWLPSNLNLQGWATMQIFAIILINAAIAS